MSFAQEHPVRCAKAAEGCTATVPGSHWHQVRAAEQGWFFSRKDDAAYCPAHVPGWVPAWRARRQEGNR